MTDNLRDLIICALLPLRCDLEEPCEECRILACQDAEAVIEALGIYEDEMGTGATRRTRIISDWEKP